MAWTAPMTATPNTALTATQWNQNVRDNLLETAPAKATTVGGIFVVSATNQIAQRVPTGTIILTSENTTSLTFTDLATVGPAVTVTTGTSAIVFWEAQMTNSGAATGCLMGYAVSGATTVAATDDVSTLFISPAASQGNRASAFQVQTGLNPGSNTFTAKYRVGATTGTFQRRQLFVIPL